jgi:hypothetical protein
MGIGTAAFANNPKAEIDMLVRISEIEVYPEYLNEYIKFAKEVAETSVKNESGVVAIYPMMQIGNNRKIRILEIYKNRQSYEKHIASPHFKKYKEGTLRMVKSLELVDMRQISSEIFEKIFKKN